MHNDISEQKLAALLATDRQTAVGLAYERYVRSLTAVCSRYVVDDEDVKDVLHDSFLKIINSAGSFVYRGEGSLRAWMTRIVVNESLKFIGRTRHVDFDAVTEEVADRDEEPEIADVPSSVIYGFIRELPDGYRLVFNLFVIEGRSHREIAGTLGISEGTSASQLHRAKALLSSKIKKYLKSL